MDEESVKAVKKEIGASELRILGAVYWLLHPSYWWVGALLFLAGCLISDSARWKKKAKKANGE